MRNEINTGKPHRSRADLITFAVFCVVLGIIAHGEVFACTIAVSADDRHVIVGNNEDYLDPRTCLWFVPASEENHGLVYWGYDRFLYAYQGGMNEKGLFIDINAIPSSGWKNSPDKPDFNGDVVQEVLTRFETVEEVVRFFNEFDIDLGWVKYVVADASGDSAIFEWLADTVHVVRKDGPYLISTNYLSPKEHTEPRYQIAEKILAQPAEPSVAQMRRVLSGTAYDVYISQTLYSTICDLRAKTLNVYHFHNFEEVITFDLLKELEKGEVKLPIPELFDIRPHYEFWFDASSAEIGADDLGRAVEEHGVEGAIERFDNMRADTRSYNKYIFEEWSLRSLGLNYMNNGRLPEAIAILELAAGLYPDSWEIQVALAEARLASGQKDLAIRSYQKALSINPDDTDIRGALDKLRQ